MKSHPHRSKAELLRELDHQRERLTRRGAEVEAAADLGLHWRRSVGRHPIAWIGGSAVAGLAAARILVAAAAAGKSSQGQKSASHRRNSVLPTMPVAVSFLAQAAYKAFRPQLEKAFREWFDRAASQLTDRDAATGKPSGAPRAAQ